MRALASWASLRSRSLTAVAIIEGVAILLLGLLVAGLLRSHADILRALHELGAGQNGELGAGAGTPVQLGSRAGRAGGGHGATAAVDVAGVAPDGEAVSIGVSGADHRTLLAFLSSGCTTCSGFWEAFGEHDGAGPAVPGDARLVVVTRDPSHESPSQVHALAPARVPVVMSTEAWEAYDVPVAPWFVLVDGRTGQVVGEGAASRWDQVVSLLGQALADAGEAPGGPGPGPGRVRRVAERVSRADLEREARADRELLAAGLHPGHPDLHPEPRRGLGDD